jgi:hypothetical protein
MNDDSTERGNNLANIETKARFEQVSLGRLTWRLSTDN